jgi:hypothetical protein
MIDAREPRDRHVATYDLELVRLGAASESACAWVAEHLRECPRCAELERSWRAAHDEFAEQASLRSIEPRSEVKALVAKNSPVPRRILIAAMVAPIAAGLLLFLLPPKSRVPAGENLAAAGSDIVEKGGPNLALVARRGDRVFAVTSREKLRAGDQIRFVLQNATYPFVLIASVDGGGGANIYAPYDAVESARFGPSERLEIPGSIVIDASPGPERVFALLSSRPLRTADVRVALAAIGARGVGAIRDALHLDIGADAEATVMFEKEGP